jgi:small-conductance mechanosensitive channel
MDFFKFFRRLVLLSPDYCAASRILCGAYTAIGRNFLFPVATRRAGGDMERMELLITDWIDGLRDWSFEILETIAGATFLELLFMGILPVLALLLGGWINHRIDRIEKTSWQSRLIDFAGPLLSPFFSLLFFSVALEALKTPGSQWPLLHFGFKLSVAWFAIRAVILMSSRKTAGWVIALVIIPLTLMHFLGLWSPVTSALKAIKFTIGTVKLTAYLVFKSLLAIVVLFWVSGFVVRLVEHRLNRLHSVNISTRALMSKLFQIVLYFVVFIVILQIVGIDLTALSVFGGALGVGLGFGLQKIASNFISGIILLFEKSVQVGDMIELTDGTLGTVKQTGARYTLIETLDAREVLIPNEDFITQRMVNWTYSSKRARAEISLGVSYGTDLELAKQLMLNAAAAHPKCLADPAPSCFIIDFGESAIRMTLYFWIADITDGRLEPRSDILLAIWQSFREHGISIPFPQREVRVISRPEISDAAAPATISEGLR